MSNIEWTTKTWNPTTGCNEVSSGCQNCYAATMHKRLTWMGQKKYSEPFHTFVEHPAALDLPLGIKKPTTFFVNSMSDLFHHKCSNQFIAAVFGVMAACPQHTFQILTKRAERLPEWFAWMGALVGPPGAMPLEIAECDPLLGAQIAASQRLPGGHQTKLAKGRGTRWPLPNVHLGVSVEDQATADKRIPHLLGAPAAVRFVSYEPALEAVRLDRLTYISGTWTLVHNALTGHRATSSISGLVGPALGWIIVGGESGSHARPFDIAWARSVIAQCREAGVPCFHKQVGSNVSDSEIGTATPWPDSTRYVVDGATNSIIGVKLRSKKGGDMSEWPEDLRVREFPVP